MERRKSKQIAIGGVKVGGDAPISIQSMTKTDTRDVKETLAQIAELAGAGCEIIRVAVPDATAGKALKKICVHSPLPVIADIHFDYRLALLALKAGVDGLRINPGNIGADWKVKEVVKGCQERKVPIRVGVNAGSLKKEIARKYGGATPEALVGSALEEVHLIEKQGYGELKISVKAFDINTTLKAYRLLAPKVDYPFHIGITEAGPLLPGAVRSAIGIGYLLREGLGDTIRVSLTAPPVEEVKVGKEILQALGLRKFGPVIISCPTCGRCRIDLLSLVQEVDERITLLSHPEALAGITIAVMGCEVNGPGEARWADVGIASGKDSAILFKEGQILRQVPTSQIIDALMNELSDKIFLK